MPQRLAASVAAGNTAVSEIVLHIDNGSFLTTRFSEDRARRGRARSHRKPARQGGGRNSHRLGNARKVQREGNAARVWHWDHRRESTARTGAGAVHDTGTLRLRPRYSFL